MFLHLERQHLQEAWAQMWRGDLTEGFLRYWFGGLIFGGTDFRNFTVCLITQCHEIYPSVFVAGV